MREKWLAMLDVVLRVPPLFIMDHVLIVSFGTAKRVDLHSEFMKSIGRSASEGLHSLSVLNHNYTERELYSVENGDQSKVDSIALNEPSLGSASTLFIYTHMFLLSLGLFILPNRHLIAIYRFIASLSAIALSYYFNREYVNFLFSLPNGDIVFELLTQNSVAVYHTVCNFFVQLFAAALFVHCTALPLRRLHQLLIGFILLLPLALSPLFLIMSLHLITSIRLLTLLAASLYAGYSLVVGFVQFVNSIVQDFNWCRYIVRYHGLYALFENQWSRLQVPQVLKVFWLSKMCEQIVVILAHVMQEHYETHGHIGFNSDWIQLLFPTVRQLLITGCETIISILGMSSILCSISNCFGELMQRFLMVVSENDEKSIGAISAILFFVLALQTGLTEISADKRFIRLYQNLCLLLTANLHILHNTLNSLLFWLSASRNRSLNRHLRALSVCLFLITFSVWLLSYLWKTHSVSTWLLAVLAFCVEMILKVILTVVIYVLFMVDAYKSSMWENLDDYVFYIKSLGSTIEFIFAILIFMNGAWILVFESGGRIRAFMMGVHAYFNIWLQAKAGIKVFIKRKKAVQKLNLLREATQEDLQNFDDVCAICYQELNSAKITNCRHFFHAICLRKWLNIQDICPICHEVIFPQEASPTVSNVAPIPTEENNNPLAREGEEESVRLQQVGGQDLRNSDQISDTSEDE